jgi:hypothetical protein
MTGRFDIGWEYPEDRHAKRALIWCFPRGGSFIVSGWPTTHSKGVFT